MALVRGKSPKHNRTVKYWLLMESYKDVLYVHVMIWEIKRTCHDIVIYYELCYGINHLKTYIIEHY